LPGRVAPAVRGLLCLPKLNPNVLVMKAANDWHCHDRAGPIDRAIEPMSRATCRFCHSDLAYLFGFNAVAGPIAACMQRQMHTSVPPLDGPISQKRALVVHR